MTLSMCAIKNFRTNTLAHIRYVFAIFVLGGALAVVSTPIHAAAPLIHFGGFVTQVVPCYTCKDFGCVATMLTIAGAPPLLDTNIVVHNTSILKLWYQLHPATYVLGSGYPDPTCFTPFRDSGKWKWRPLSVDIAVFQMGTSKVAPL